MIIERKVYHDEHQGWCWKSDYESLCFSGFKSNYAAMKHAGSHPFKDHEAAPSTTAPDAAPVPPL